MDPAPGGLYASGADGALIRATLAHSVQKGWGIGTTDIRTAFLLAPRPRDSSTREVIVVPPKVMVEAGVCGQTERWRVHHALYGFTSSPAHWAVHRDATMTTFNWTLGNDSFSLKQTEEGNFWKIMRTSPTETDPVCEGHIIVYVDDIMVLSTDEIRESFFKRLEQEWKCAEIETVGKTGWLRFCGFELKRHENGVSLMVGQRSYTAELLKRHQDVTPKMFPMPKVDGNEGVDETPSQSEVKAAQGITGELLWLSVRSRPDISYAISIMSRNVMKKPQWVQTIGKHVLGFLMNTPETCLVYSKCDGSHGPYGTLQIPRHSRLLEAFADISFNPQGERSHQGIILCVAGAPIQWEASRQAFHTMSTAESELVGYCEATTMLKSAEALMTVIQGCGVENDDSFEKVIYGDNSSALSILMNPDGGWRTRHLRLRSACLRELLRKDPQSWKVRHQKGTDLPADMLTKPIVLQRDWVKFWHFLGFHVDAQSSQGVERKRTECFQNSNSNSSLLPSSDATVGTEEKLTKIKVLTTIAALTVAATTTRTPPRARVACAAVAAACAGWLASRSCTSGSPKSGAVNSEEIEREEKNRKEESMNQRAIGLKKMRKIVEDTEQRKEDSQGKMNLRDQNLTKLTEQNVETHPQKDLGMIDPKNLGATDPQESLGIVDPKSLGIVDPKNLGMFDWGSLGETTKTVVGQFSGKASNEQSSQASGSLIDTARTVAAVHQHYCPSGCPEREDRLNMEAKTSSHGGCENHGRDGRLPGDDQGREPDGPWRMPRFLVPPSVKTLDQWNCLDYNGRQYWVKVHHSPRLKPFHPLHRNQPFDVEVLNSDRVTVKFFANDFGRPQKIFDTWTSRGEKHDTLPKGEDRWLGYTFFEVKKEKSLWKEPVIPQSFNERGRQDGSEEAHRGRGSGSPMRSEPAVPWDEPRIPQSYKGGSHQNAHGDLSGGKGRGGPLVAIHVYGPTIELADNLIAYEGPSSTQEHGYGKSHGKGAGREEPRYGYAHGGAGSRGAAVMSQGPVVTGLRTEGRVDRQESGDDWSFVAEEW